jgi:hypothetical protein
MKATKKKNPAKLRKRVKKPAAVPAAGQSAAKTRFLQDLAIRGEASELTDDGKLPSQATHAVTKNPDGTVQVKRARFKLA